MDPYFTVQPHSLIRQHLDYGHWYDRTKLTLKEIHNTQYLSCMNPTAGSFTIDPRLLRHFNVFALSFPGQDALHTIYSNILSQHLILASFPIVSSCTLFTTHSSDSVAKVYCFSSSVCLSECLFACLSI